MVDKRVDEAWPIIRPCRKRRERESAISCAPLSAASLSSVFFNSRFCSACASTQLRIICCSGAHVLDERD